MDVRQGEWHALTEESLTDPITDDRRLRDTCPVAHSDDFGGFHALFRYEDIVAVARDPETFSSSPSIGIPRAPEGAAPLLPLQADPPEHRAYRAVVAPLFRASRLQSFEPTLRTMANELIDRFIDRGTADLATEFCVPLPATALCLLMGLPLEDWKQLHAWSTASQAAQSAGDPAGRLAVQRLIYEYCDGAVERRRGNPADDVMTAMLEATIDGRPLTRQQMHGMFHLLIAAGHETTANALSSALHYLAGHPTDRNRLRNEPDILQPAVEELLRWGAPVRILGRTATRDVEIGGRTIESGSMVGVMWASGCRDERVFPDPDVCDFDRKANNHISFGVGLHRCLGEHLARMEMRVGISEFLNRVDDFDVVGETKPALWPTIGFRELPVRFSAR